MQIIIVGVGKVGRTLLEFLEQDDHDITVIDTNPIVIEDILERFDVNAVVGNGASYKVLVEAEVEKADVLIAATSSDEVNILCCLVSKRYGVTYTVPRVRDPEYSNQKHFFLTELGISTLINPELDTANEIADILRFPSALTIEPFANGRAKLVEFLVKEDSFLIGKPLFQSMSALKSRVLICAVERDGKAYIPDGNFIIEPNDKLHFTSDKRELMKFFRKLHILKNRARKVMVIGGGRITYYLAKQLDRQDVQIKIIEMDEKRCYELSELLPHVDIIHGIGSDQELLIQEGIEAMDAIVTLTGYDEENIIISLYADLKKVPKIITKLNRYNYSEILKMVRLDSILSPKVISANHILRFIRSIEQASDSEMLTLYKLMNNQVEAVEFMVHEESPIIGIELMELELKPEVLITSIIRANHVIIPSGKDMIKANDRVVIVSKSQRIRTLEDIMVKS